MTQHFSGGFLRDDTTGALVVSGGTSASSIYAPSATGTAATDTANLAAAITATPAGGTLYLDGHYKINAALSVTRSITLAGSVKVTYTGLSALPSGPNVLSQVQGAIIEQTTAATDCITCTAAGEAFHMRDVTVGFTSGLASTGHGINCAPASNVVGVYGGTFDGVLVFGHDGNHYGLVLNNVLEVTTRDFRWSGGGGILTVAQTGVINYGNNVHIHPYGVVAAAGTAHGIAHSSATGSLTAPGNGGMLNLIVYVRPQVNVASAAGTLGTQKMYTDSVGAGFPWYVSLIGSDFEASGYANALDFGPMTAFVGDCYVTTTTAINLPGNQFEGYLAGGPVGQNATTQQKSTGFGYQALGALTTATANTAVGYFTLPAHSTGSGQNTAVGYSALQAVTTGNSNTAVGANSGGTSLTTQTNNTFVGAAATTNGNNFCVTALGQGAQGNASRTTALGQGTTVGASGGVAIGVDNAGTPASTSTANVIALGTALHQIQVKNNTTGAGSAALGANSPAVTNTAPYTWLKLMSSDGSTVYVPAWK